MRRSVSRKNPNATGKMVMFRDSYATALMKFLSHSFGRTVFVWQQNWDKGFIEREKPDIVILELVERLFQGIGPRLPTDPPLRSLTRCCRRRR